MESSLAELMGKLSVSGKDSWLQEPSVVPFEGIGGHWVQAKDFRSKRNTFGYFRCNYCSKNWMSAYSKKSYKQGCKECKRYFYATHLWENDYDPSYKRQKKTLEDNHKPHLSKLCEACKKGQCKQRTFIF